MSIHTRVSLPSLKGICKVLRMASTASSSADPTAITRWLLKAEPEPHIVGGKDVGSQPFSLMVQKGSLTYDGVRNYTARNTIRDKIKEGQLCFYYHSSCSVPAILGIAEVVKTYPDPRACDPSWVFYDAKHSASEPRWFNVDLKPVRALKRPVTLAEIRALGAEGGPLASIALLRQSRLSVQPVTDAEWDVIVAQENAPPAAPTKAKAAVAKSSSTDAKQTQSRTDMTTLASEAAATEQAPSAEGSGAKRKRKQDATEGSSSATKKPQKAKR